MIAPRDGPLTHLQDLREDSGRIIQAIDADLDTMKTNSSDVLMGDLVAVC